MKILFVKKSSIFLLYAFITISREQVLVTDFSEILEKLSVIIPQFLGIMALSLSFEKYLRISPQFFPKKYSANFCRKLLRNSQLYLVTNFTDFFGELNQRLYSQEIPENFSGIFHGEIPENFYEIFVRKLLRNSQVLVTNFTNFLGNWLEDIVSRSS